MYLVKVISSKIDKAKRRVVKLLKSGKNDTRTAFQASPFGYDSAPVEDKDLIAVYGYTARRGEAVVIGYINRNAIAEAGELRLYSMNGSGVEKSYVYIKNDGTIEVNGMADNFVTFADMKVAFDQLKLELNSHLHTGNLGAPTGPATPPATADMSGAKSKNVKTE